MGNEHSQTSGIEIDERAIEVSDFWSQHNATINNLDHISKLSIFMGDLFINEPFWTPQTPLERFSKNLMVYRHPCIIRYISSWQKACKFYLAIEEVTPLSQAISQMSTMQICLGLYSILNALCFLHENASVSHNNLCLASIFVSREGSWKLGGLEYLCSYKNLTAEYLQKSRAHRYSKAIDSNEDKHLSLVSKGKDFVDVFAFCTLALELLKNKTDDDIPNLIVFKEFCIETVRQPNVLQRPKLDTLLKHEFFKHKFISIHSYLIELPLKSDTEKTEFFTRLKAELEMLNEEIVATQLGKLLVSRMVLLNKTAKNFLLPYIMVPRKGENSAIFSEKVFKKYIAPKLLDIFCVRDVQIRLLLLEYFPHLIDCFSKEELQSHILPELLVGIKDTNNELVAATLHTLAELVSVLGAEVVIGGKRSKLFTNGQPKNQSSSRKSSKVINKQQETSDVSNILNVSHSIIENNSQLPERPRPDGEEGETSTDEIEQSADEDAENWEDWDTENVIESGDLSSNEQYNHVETIGDKNNTTDPVIKKFRKILDITELDIKNHTKDHSEQSEIDFFEDMEPVIKTSSKFLINHKENSSESLSNKLSVKTDTDNQEEGWGDEWE